MTGFFAVWAEGVLLTGSMWGFSATPAPGGAFASFLGMSNSLAFVASHGFGYVGGHLDVFYPTACLYHVWAFWGVEGQHPRVRVQYFVVFFIVIRWASMTLGISSTISSTVQSLR